MTKILSDGGPNLVGKVIENMASMQGIGRMKTYQLHPQANGTLERWSRTLARYLAGFMTTGDSDWDEHVSLACFGYNTGVCEATGITPYKGMFGADAFEARGDTDLCLGEEEAGGLARRLSILHKELIGKAKGARNRAKTQYDKTFKERTYDIGDRVLLWSLKIGKDEGNVYQALGRSVRCVGEAAAGGIRVALRGRG